MAKAIVTIKLKLSDGTYMTLDESEVISLDFLNQSQTDCSQLQTGVVPSTGTLKIKDGSKRLLDAINAGTLTSDSIRVKAYFNDKIFMNAISTSAKYTLSNYTLSISLTDELNNLQYGTYSGREQVKGTISTGGVTLAHANDTNFWLISSSDTLAPYISAIPSYLFNDTTNLNSVGADDEYIPVSIGQSMDYFHNGVEGTYIYGLQAGSYISHFGDYYSLVSQKSNQDLLEEVCQVGLLQMFRRNWLDNDSSSITADIVYVCSSRPVVNGVNTTTAAYIPIENQFSDFDIDILPRNKYTKIVVKYTSRWNYWDDLELFYQFAALNTSGKEYIARRLHAVGALNPDSSYEVNVSQFSQDASASRYEGIFDTTVLTDNAIKQYATQTYESIAQNSDGNDTKQWTTSDAIFIDIVNIPEDGKLVKLKSGMKINSVKFTGFTFAERYMTVASSGATPTSNKRTLATPSNLETSNEYFKFNKVEDTDFLNLGLVQWASGVDYLTASTYITTLASQMYVNQSDDFLGPLQAGKCGGLVYTITEEQSPALLMYGLFLCIQSASAKIYPISVSQTMCLPCTNELMTFAYADSLFISLDEYSEESTYTQGTDDSIDNSHTLVYDLTANELFTNTTQDTWCKVEQYKYLGDVLANDFANGIKSASVTVSVGDYYCYSDRSTKSKAQDSGDLFYVNDVVKLEQDTNFWRVRGVRYKYDGRLTMELQLQEAVVIPPYADSNSLALSAETDSTSETRSAKAK